MVPLMDHPARDHDPNKLHRVQSQGQVVEGKATGPPSAGVPAPASRDEDHSEWEETSRERMGLHEGKTGPTGLAGSGSRP